MPYPCRSLRFVFVAILTGILLSMATVFAPGRLRAQIVGPLANPNPNNYDTAKILAAIRNPGSDLVILAAHRGTHALAMTDQAPGVPENSLQSIGKAAQAGWEAIEIDVKTSQDGVPIISHDSTWGREWCGRSDLSVGNKPYDPFTPPGNSANDQANPLVANTTLSNTRSWFGTTTLRDSVTLVTDTRAHGCTDTSFYAGEYPPTLQNVYDYIRDNHIQIILELDIKDAPTSTAAWAVVQSNKDDRGRPVWDSTIFKVPAIAFPNTNTYLNTFGQNYPHVKFNPVFHTAGVAQAQAGAADVEEGDIPEPATASFGGEPAMNHWIDAFMSYSSPARIDVVAIEVSMKEPANTTNGGILSTVRDHVLSKSVPISQFHSVPEYYVNNDSSQGEFFRSNNGQCCYQQQEYLYNNKNKQGPFGLPYDHDDHRGEMAFLIGENHATMITTDTPGPFASYLNSQGRRNTSRFKADANTPAITSSTAPAPVTLTTSATAAKEGDSLALTGTVHPDSAAGVLTFFDGYTNLGTAGISSGSAHLTVNSIKSGSHYFTAVYGDPNSNDNVKSNSVTVSVSGGGSSSGGGNGSVASAPTIGTTYSINTGPFKFLTTQPQDSVATFTWTDGQIGSIQEWLTSANGTSLGYSLTPVSPLATNGSGAAATITVNTGTTYQTIDGFGGAMTDSAAYLIGGSSHRNSIMQLLFGHAAGAAGLTFVRSPMGSSDLMASGNDIHTYQDSGGFSTTAHASDTRQIDLLTQAAGIAGSALKIIGTPWSSPGAFKNGGSLLPAQCGTEQDEFNTSSLADYARYFENYVNDYNNRGLRPWAVSLQNEPENCKTAMPTTLLSANDEVRLAQYLRYYLPSNLNVKVLGWDHNWNDADYVNTLTTSGAVDLIGYHCYDGTHYGSQTQAVPTYVTECSGFTSSTANVAQNLGFEVANLLIGPMRYGSKGSLYWSLAQDPNGNPHLSGNDACQNCRGMITVNSDGSFSPSQDYYFYSQFSAFVPPGSVRVASNNAGDLSTIAFHNQGSTTLVVLNSSTHADGGSPSNDEENLVRHIVQWDGDQNAQKAAWFVGADGYRRYINDGSTYNCLVYDAGYPPAQAVPSGALDKYINLLNVWAVCNTQVMGSNSELEVGTYLKSGAGAKLVLASNGLYSTDSSGNPVWTAGATGDRLILQKDGNLVLYKGNAVQWSSNTQGSGAAFLSVRDDGSLALFDKNNTEVWHVLGAPLEYRGKMVEWDQDSNTQKTSWQVGWDKNRRFVPNLATFQCLHDSGAGNSYSVSSDTLNVFPDLTGVQATCGVDRVGATGSLEPGAYITASGYKLIMQTDGNLVEYDPSSKQIWSSNTAGSDGKELAIGQGQILLVNSSGQPLHTWSGSGNRNPGYLVLGTNSAGNKGMLILYDSTGTEWCELNGPNACVFH